MPDDNEDPPMTPDSRELPIAFWLMPCAADLHWLNDVIAALARTHSTPNFAAHVSLHVGSVNPDKLQPVIDQVAGLAPPTMLTAGSTLHGPTRFRALTIDLPTGPLCALADALAARVPIDPSFRLDAHLSLIYGEFDENLRSALAASHDYRGRRLRFDAIAAVAPAIGARDFADVSGWRIIAEARLRGGLRAG
ncbi:MAG: hypothetical protein R3E83_02290 [Burkholderiaceae bacterium]